MKRYGWMGIVLLWMGWNPAQFARAQEFCVVTKVFNEGDQLPTADKSHLLVQSLTIFHAGKVYDYLDGIKEVTILEPAHNRVTLLSVNRLLATTVDFDEIRNLQNVARNETEKYIGELQRKPGPETDKAIEILKFHWNPKFDEQYDAMQRRLQLTSRYFRYQVLVAQTQEPEIVKAYLEYADRTAQLNSVLHPRSLPPGPRMMLNESLRARNLIPLEVKLWADLESDLHLRAKHQFNWELDDTDRRSIQSWDMLLKDRNVKYVAFADYQRAVNVVTQVPKPGSTR